ncbi:hypothetical protein QUC31_011099 [Theobroma cacao]
MVDLLLNFFYLCSFGLLGVLLWMCLWLFWRCGDCGSKLLKEKGLLPELSLEVDNIVCALDYDLQGVAATVATKLRGKGQSVDLVLESKPLKWVFKRAARANAERLILVGNTEWQKGMVGVKILSSGEQYEIKLDELE